MNSLLIIIFIILYCVWWLKFQGTKEVFASNMPIHKPPHHKHHHPKHHHGILHEHHHHKHHRHHGPSHKHHPHGPHVKNKKLDSSKFINDYSPIIISMLLIASVILYTYNSFLSTIFIFIITMITIFLRPRDINEAYPASVGAIILIAMGGIYNSDLIDISHKISGASITIIATIVMAITLESFGFFHWVGSKISQLCKGSGYRLYWLIQALSFIMTLLFNNDGSILITTPILILVLRNLNLKTEQQIPYLLSSALMCTASSAPIGVSNITNLIALNIVHMTLYMHTAMMFVPCTLGLAFMSFLMYKVLKKKLPENLPPQNSDLEEDYFIPLFKSSSGKVDLDTPQKRTKFMLKVLAFVFGIRCLLFVESFLHIPIEIIAVLGSIILLSWRWYYFKVNPKDIIKKIPWFILVFAFSMYVIIYGLDNIGLIDTIVRICEPLVKQNLFNASLIMGTLISILSNMFNNHPALMVGTISLTQMGLNPITLKIIYLANIVGSDIGSLILPIGTLASLMWFYILKRNKIKVTWSEYISLTIKVIPLTVFVTLLLLFVWVTLVFA